MNKPTLKAIHPDISRDQVAQCRPHKPKLVNKYVFAIAKKDANKIERNQRNEKSTGHNKGYT